ncbi:MAG: hypothetical protein QSU88_11770, partial [Candidatus Methanoperedens sp.]|nr:hypothetical protein [Candidatus Methanoperedens sp.]
VGLKEPVEPGYKYFEEIRNNSVICAKHITDLFFLFFSFLMNKRHLVWYLFFLIIILSFFLRIYHLGERVPHQDEAAVGYITYKL